MKFLLWRGHSAKLQVSETTFFHSRKDEAHSSGILFLDIVCLTSQGIDFRIRLDGSQQSLHFRSGAGSWEPDIIYSVCLFLGGPNSP